MHVLLYFPVLSLLLIKLMSKLEKKETYMAKCQYNNQLRIKALNIYGICIFQKLQPSAKITLT
jgi:hypothetical protein